RVAQMRKPAVAAARTKAAQADSHHPHREAPRSWFFLQAVLGNEELGSLLADDDTGRHCVAGSDARHDRRVGYSQTVDTMDAQLAVDDGHLVTTHLGRAALVPVSHGRIAQPAFKCRPRESPRHDLALDEWAHGCGVTDFATNLDGANHGL